MNHSHVASIMLALCAATAFSEEIPLPEHPRPDFERSQWMNLNGLWDFGFKPEKYDAKILVPFGWGAPLSRVKSEGDTGYYRRRVMVPADWKGKRVFVVVGAADHDTTCRFAGAKLGKHVGGYTPFEYELTEFVRWGEEQTLEFDVWDPPIGHAAESHYLVGKQGYGNVRGIWQTVYLEARGREYIENVRFYPCLSNATVVACAKLGSPACRGMTMAFALDGKTFKADVAPGQQLVSVECTLANPKLWNLDNPFLYDVIVSLSEPNAAPCDTVKSYFGFREIGTGKNPNGDAYVTLNGKPIYLQMCLDQSYHPDGFYTFPTDAFMKNEILISKRLALSGNRVHIKAEIPRKLYWADKLGVLIQADVPCAWGDASEAMFREHWECFEGMVNRDFNHPCVYQWTLFNETWGLFSNRSIQADLGAKQNKRVYRESAQRAVANAYLKAKLADPTRLVEDNSACCRDHIVTDVNSWHAYYTGYDWNYHLDRICAKTFVGSPSNYASGHVQDGAPMMNSECGNVWGYQGSTGDCDFTWDYHRMINAFRRHTKCAGWLYTEHHDVCNEWNGYVRFDRSPKYDGFDELAQMTLADLHRDAAITFGGRPDAQIADWVKPGAKITLPVGVSFVTDRYAGQFLTLVCREWYYDADGRKVELPEVAAPSHPVAKSWQCEDLWSVPFSAPEKPAAGCLVFSLKAGGREIARNFWSFGVTVEDAKPLVALHADWSCGATNVLGGLKLNGFGKGAFVFDLPAPANGGIFRAELSAKRLNAKDVGTVYKRAGLDDMLGGGTRDRSKNPNSYPQTSNDKHVSHVKVYVADEFVREVTLEDDPADSRGILSWLSQLREPHLHEAGSYGFLVEAPVKANAVKDGRVTVRLEADNGLAVYGAKFGRYPLDPSIR